MCTAFHYNAKAVRVLDGLSVPQYLLDVVSLGPSFSYLVDGVEATRSAYGWMLRSVAAVFSHPDAYPDCAMSVGGYQSVLGVLEDRLAEESSPSSFNVPEDGHVLGLQRTLLRSLQSSIGYLAANPRIIVVAADKGKVGIVCLRATLDMHTQRHLVDGEAQGLYTLAENNLPRLMEATYKRVLGVLRRNLLGPSSTYAANADLFRHLGLTYLTADSCWRDGVLRGSLKVHKPVVALRPIINTRRHIGCQLEGYVLTCLNKLWHWKERIFHISNSRALMDVLVTVYGNGSMSGDGLYGAPLVLPSKCVIHNIDFVSMYTNVPVPKVLDYIKTTWDDYAVEVGDSLTGDTLRELCNFYAVRIGCFMYGGKRYRQQQGELIYPSFIIYYFILLYSISIYPFIYSPIHSFIYLFIHLSIHLFIRSFIHLSVHLSILFYSIPYLIYLFIHSFIHLFIINLLI